MAILSGHLRVYGLDKLYYLGFDSGLFPSAFLLYKKNIFLFKIFGTNQRSHHNDIRPLISIFNTLFMFDTALCGEMLICVH